MYPSQTYEHKKRVREANPEANERYRRSIRNQAFKSRYGITHDQYDEMVEAQGGVCALCGKTDKRRLAVDHDHSTGRVRGLLCTSCNHLLGRLGDGLAGALRLVEYLKEDDALSQAA